jgi:hypothetical protein
LEPRESSTVEGVLDTSQRQGLVEAQAEHHPLLEDDFGCERLRLTRWPLACG